jgi:hypothetical protein
MQPTETRHYFLFQDEYYEEIFEYDPNEESTQEDCTMYIDGM